MFIQKLKCKGRKPKSPDKIGQCKLSALRFERRPFVSIQPAHSITDLLKYNPYLQCQAAHPGDFRTQHHVSHNAPLLPFAQRESVPS